MSDDSRKIKVNVVLNFVYHILTWIIPLITTPYISRVIGPDNIGRHSYSYSVAYYFVMFAMLGLSNYGNRAIALAGDNKKEVSRVFWSIYYGQIFMSVLSMLAYIVYILLFSSDKTLDLIMGIYVISALFDVSWFFFGRENFKSLVIVNTFIKIVNAVLVFALVREKTDLYMYSFIVVGSTILSQIYLWGGMLKTVEFVRPHYNEIKVHIKPNMLLFIPVVAISLYRYMDKIMLGIICLKSEVGFYECCERIVQIPSTLVNALGIVMLPRIAKLISQGNKNSAESHMKKSIQFCMCIIFSMTFGIMAVSDVFVPWFYGEGYGKCVDLFLILLPSCWFLAFANVIRTQYLIPFCKDKIYVTSIIVGALLNLGVNALLIPRYQSVGAAIGTLIAEFSVCIIQTISVRNERPVFLYLKECFPYFISGVVMYSVVSNVSMQGTSAIYNLILKVIIGIIVYSALVGGVIFVRSHKRKQR